MVHVLGGPEVEFLDDTYRYCVCVCLCVCLCIAWLINCAYAVGLAASVRKLTCDDSVSA